MIAFILSVHNYTDAMLTFIVNLNYFATSYVRTHAVVHCSFHVSQPW